MDINLIQFGLEHKVFTCESVMCLLYGRVGYSYHEVTATKQSEEFCKWDAFSRIANSWNIVPIDLRKEVIAQIIQTIKKDYSDYDCFHIRILCLLHDLLDDEENKIECNCNYPWGRSTSTERKYSAFLIAPLIRPAVFEMFLWYHSGVSKTKAERKLFRQCWKTFLGRDDVRATKQRMILAEQRVAELEAEAKRIERRRKFNDALIKRYAQERREIKKRHLSAVKKNLLLHRNQECDNAAHHRFWAALGQQDRCDIALGFLNGYLDFIKTL